MRDKAYVRHIARQQVNRLLNEHTDSSINAACFDREDLMEVAESIASQIGDIALSEDLCDAMATAAYNFLSKTLIDGSYRIDRF